MDPGETLEDGRYVLRGALGKGGMATVYVAHDTRLDVPRAVKVLDAKYANNAEIIERLAREARALARLDHPNLVRVFDVRAAGGEAWLVLELVRGGSLIDRVRSHGPLPPVIACRTVAQALDGLATAHQAGVVHRDLKPHNILLTTSGVPKVADFGVALEGTEGNLTTAGGTLGTPAYMAPEQRHDASAVDHRADLYAAGGTLFTLLTGELPTDLDNRDSHAKRLAGLPSPVAELLAKACSFTPEARFEDASSMADALRELADALPEDPPHLPLVTAASIEALPLNALRLEGVTASSTWVGGAEPASETVDSPTYDSATTDSATHDVANELVQATPPAELSLWERTPDRTRATLGSMGSGVAVWPIFLAIGLFGGGTFVAAAAQATAMAGLVAAALGLFSFLTYGRLKSRTDLVVAAGPDRTGGLIRQQWRRVPRGWRLFLGMSVPFGGAMGVTAAMGGAPLLLAAGLGAMAGVVFGAIMALYAGMSQVIAVSSGGERNVNLSCEQTARLMLRADPGEVYDVALAAVTELGVAAEENIDREAGEILVQTRLGLWSHGEVVHISIHPDGDYTVVAIHSRPWVPTTLVDHGVNRANVAAISDALVDAFPIDLEDPALLG